MAMTLSRERDVRETIAKAYAAALRTYVLDEGEAALAQAYALGREALAHGIGVLEMAAIHYEAVLAVSASVQSGSQSLIPLAAQFLNESLSPFEMTMRAYQANARLLGLSEMVAERTADTDRARDQLQMILDATTAVIYLKDADGRYVFVNRQFQKVFHVRREQMIGKTDAEALPPPLAEALRRHDQPILAAGEPEEVEATVPLDDGPHTYIALKFPLRDGGGAPYALCSVATDITERKHADETLRKAKEAAESANRELESFSYSIAHDLRAPLRSIDGFSQALVEDCGDRLDREGRKYLQFVRDSAQHMAHLIDDLLALSRVSQSALQPSTVDLSLLARCILEGLQAADSGRSVESVIQEGVVASGDPHLLRAVLENLLGNAWKFSGRCPVARIEFGADMQRRPVVYFVRDNGAGFDMAYAGKLFGVFQRLHSAREFDGTGIGLATVLRIIQRHGGRVWAESEVERGSTFYFTLGEESARE
jgi:PAS domain S-box-containing protein